MGSTPQRAIKIDPKLIVVTIVYGWMWKAWALWHTITQKVTLADMTTKGFTRVWEIGVCATTKSFAWFWGSWEWDAIWGQLVAHT